MGTINTLIENETIYKYYFFEDMQVKPDVYLHMQREFQVSQMARQCRLQHVLGLRQVYLSYNHVAFEQKYYPYDLRQYLRNKRDHRQLPLIFT